jgi:hypothetical protein
LNALSNLRAIFYATNRDIKNNEPDADLAAEEERGDALVVAQGLHEEEVPERRTVPPEV